MASRVSMYSVASEGLGGPRGPGQQPAQVSTTTLLSTVHNIYLASQAYRLDAGTSLVVNTWLTATQQRPDGSVGGTVDAALAARAWEHARRRAEDGCIILSSLHQSTPSLLRPFLSSLPLPIPSILFTALEAIEPFLRCVTPYNPSSPRQSALGVTLTLKLGGNLTAATLALSQGGIDTDKGLLGIPAEAGYRAFDVFYYLLTSASTPAEREFLGLKPASDYALLRRSGTYEPPSYLPTADDSAAADDFRSALKELGIKGSAHRNLISTLAALLKLGDTLDYQLDGDAMEEMCEDVGGLLGVDPEVLARQCTTEDRATLIGGLYEALVDWVISRANEAMALRMGRMRGDGDDASDGARPPSLGDENADTVCITVLDVPDPNLGKAISMRGVFDDTEGINAEMEADGVEVMAVGTSVLRDMQNAVAERGPDLGIMHGTVGRKRQQDLDKREEVLEKVGYSAEDDGFIKKLLVPVVTGPHARLHLPALLSSSRAWYHLCVHPTDDSPTSLAALPSVTSAWSAGPVSRQLRTWRLPEWANRRNKHVDFTADFDHDEFVQRYRALGCMDGRDGIEGWVLERGWSNGEVVVGKERVWMRENAWWEAERLLDLKPHERAPLDSSQSANGSGFFPAQALVDVVNEQVMHQPHVNMSQATLAAMSAMRSRGGPGDYGLGPKGDSHKDDIFYNDEGDFVKLDAELARGTKTVEAHPISKGRRVWVAVVWALTFWIPSPLLRHMGRMKRPDVRMAWREKLVICFFILLMNGFIVFWIVAFGRLLCPNFDKAWAQSEVAGHTADNDFWVSIHGRVYDLSTFWRLQHSDTTTQTTTANMQPFAGLNLDEYFRPPLSLACPGLVTDTSVYLLANDTDAIQDASAVHVSGARQAVQNSKLHEPDWYTSHFQPRIRQYYKGDLVWDSQDVLTEGRDDNHGWFIYDGGVYDLTDYLYTQKMMNNYPTYDFLDETITGLVTDNPGQDLTTPIDAAMGKVRLANETEYARLANSMNCIKNTFYVGMPDFRFSARCQANNYLLLAFAMVICAVILVKFLAALQFGSKRRPSPQDKFVICQVPAYTEDEDSLRKALDSLTALQYDNKRKLICVICDGVIVGAGNDRPTPKIVLDILGVDPKLDPPALPFKSVGTGSEQLNYAKVYSGLYAFEGNVVPYLVVVKVGKESEQAKAKPGNRGKRDSQILLMSFLNRVHHRAPMNPLELDMFHQINNIIGVDPELYEYLLMVDADTSVREDSLNRLVAACAGNAKIAGICGETGLQNEDRSWWTMIQVYEYFISHHLAKAFESLFGSVTCLPGCFTMYRLRTADRGKALIISDKVIGEYSDCHVDTLHKKNLLSLGEDRFLTTLMTKHFPHMSFKFIPDAYCQTASPERWSVLLSQRRRWINSTIHNLVELAMLQEMCGFCCFSMRFVVIIDLMGTIILPATCVYLGYLIYILATGTGPMPWISIGMVIGVYGLQALIFLVKRQWQHIGWMIIYLLAFPIYSFVLPVYSFWNQDNFSWGNTRMVVGESGKRVIVAVDDEGYVPRSLPLQRWDDYALLNNLPGRRGGAGYRGEKGAGDMLADAGGEAYELDDMKSVYSSVRQPSVMTGLHGASGVYAVPQSPGLGPGTPFGANPRASVALTTPYSDNPRHSLLHHHHHHHHHQPQQQHRQSVFSAGTGFDRGLSPFQEYGLAPSASTTPGPGQGHRPSMAALGGTARHQSVTPSVDFRRGSPGLIGGGPDDGVIVEAIRAVLGEVDLDTVTKKHVRALVEQRLQTALAGERRTFMDRQIDTELANM